MCANGRGGINRGAGWGSGADLSGTVWILPEDSWPACIVDARPRVIVSAVLVDDGLRTCTVCKPFGSTGEDEDEGGVAGAVPFPTSLKLLFDLNGLVFFAAPEVGGRKGFPVSFWVGAERSTSGCRPRPGWSSVLIAPALGFRECAFCGVFEKL